MSKQKTLKERVQDCHRQLQKLEVKNALYKFSLKYPKYIQNPQTKKTLRQHWFLKDTGEQFTVELEAFVTFNTVNK